VSDRGTTKDLSVMTRNRGPTSTICKFSLPKGGGGAGTVGGGGCVLQATLCFCAGACLALGCPDMDKEGWISISHERPCF
jgi:hypothetical protein